MELTISLHSRAFVFIEDFSISKSEGKKTLSLANRSDGFKRIVASSLACGVLQSDTDYKDVVASIKNDDARRLVEVDLGMREAVSFRESAIAEVIEVIEEEVVTEEVVTEEVVTEEVIGSDIEDLSKESLSELLKGSTKSVSVKLRSLDLTQSQRDKLYDLEAAGRNRSSIKSLIKK